ncbi:MAG: hypothetical protein KDK78_04280 [Chlamydiia bacterium]|nr:hypothetical protein [Chlamydiia bacterium]
MKMIVNFCVYGMTFYLIEKFLPGVFGSLVGWADAAFAYGEGLYQQAVDWLMKSGAM